MQLTSCRTSPLCGWTRLTARPWAKRYRAIMKLPVILISTIFLVSCANFNNEKSFDSKVKKLNEYSKNQLGVNISTLQYIPPTKDAYYVYHDLPEYESQIAHSKELEKLGYVVVEKSEQEMSGCDDKIYPVIKVSPTEKGLSIVKQIAQ
jgi:hypothetical protein